jgi:hypothetical protein
MLLRTTNLFLVGLGRRRRRSRGRIVIEPASISIERCGKLWEILDVLLKRFIGDERSAADLPRFDLARI